jgi:hypothetical protein
MRYVLVLLFVAVLFFGGQAVLNLVERGKKVTSSTLGASGIIEESPAELAEQAGVNIDVYSLARTISSEQETKSPSGPELIGVACVVVNEARARGLTVTDLVTSSSVGGGMYGSQSVGPRYVATSKDPYERDITIAAGVLDGSIPDITQGARHFFSPATQDILHSRDEAKYKSADDVDAKWRKDGYFPIVIDDVDDSRLRFYRKV